MFKSSISILALTLLISCFILTFSKHEEQDIANSRLNYLRKRSKENSSRIFNLTYSEFNEYITKYPRPYDVVIYFHYDQFPLSVKLLPDYQYTAKLYQMDGLIDAQINPVFFTIFNFKKNNKEAFQIFKKFDFQYAPDLIVSKPYMAIVSPTQFNSYIKQYKWQITATDNQVQTKKILEFINKRTKRQVEYRPMPETIKFVMYSFLGISLAAVIIYKFFKFIWNHWFFWFISSLIIYVTCMSGLVYCIINDIFGRPPEIKNGKMVFFGQSGRRQQGFYEGFLMSGLISLVGVIVIVIIVSGEKLKERYSMLIGVAGAFLIYVLLNYVENVYGKKSWYSPSFYPPAHYLQGPLNVDQGNNI